MPVQPLEPPAKPIMSEERQVPAQFQAPAADYDRFMGRYTPALATALAGAAGIQPGMRVLDVGCGPGRHAHALGRRGIEVVGVHTSERFVDLARQDAMAIVAEQHSDRLTGPAQENTGKAAAKNDLRQRVPRRRGEGHSIPVALRVSASVFLTPSRLLCRFSSPGRRVYACEILL